MNSIGIMMVNKVIVFGIDGAMFEHINLGIKLGFLPTFKKILKSGVHGDLKSYLPPASALIWNCMLTGKRPGNHGFFNHLVRKSGTYKTELVHSATIGSKTIQDILGEYSLESTVINLPCTYPVREVNGIMISDHLVRGKHSVFPESFIKNLKGNLFFPSEVKSISKFLKEIKHIINNQYELVRYIIDTKKHPFLFINFSAIDWASHSVKLWDSLHKKKGTHKNSILIIYQLLDQKLNNLINFYKDEYNFIIVSDHGFTKINWRFYVHEFLRKKGYLCTASKNAIKATNSTDTMLRKKNQFTELISNNKAFLRLLEWGYKNKSLLNPIKKLIPRAFKRKVPNFNIDWNRTKAYSITLDSYGIFINCRGREPRGIVDQKDYETVRKKIIPELLKLRTNDGQKAILWAKRREDYYAARFIEKAPDIVFLPRKDILPHLVISPSGEIFAPTSTTFHYGNGIFIATGPDITTEKTIKNFEAADILPTVLHLMGVPIPNDLDGKVKLDIFNKSLQRKKIIFKKKKSISEEVSDEILDEI